METKQLNFNIDKNLFETAETILDDIGLEFQSAIKIFLKRLVKEKGIAFLLQDTKPYASRIMEPNMYKNFESTSNIRKDNMQKDIKNYYCKNINVITEEMRDYIWDIFKDNKYLSYTDYRELAKSVSTNTGMNQGSAYIYFVILSCFMEGKANTRTMKFADLEFYIKRILQECTEIEFANTLESLENSVPYWEDRLQGKFAIKVQQLVNKYKTFLNN